MDSEQINKIFDKLLNKEEGAYKEFEQEQIKEEVKDLKARCKKC